MTEDHDRAAFIERLQWLLKNTPRERPGWSRRGLSEAAGQSRSHLQSVLAGEIHDVSRSAIMGYARAAGVRPAWLLLGDGDPFEERGVDPPLPHGLAELLDDPGILAPITPADLRAALQFRRADGTATMTRADWAAVVAAARALPKREMLAVVVDDPVEQERARRQARRRGG